MRNTNEIVKESLYVTKIHGDLHKIFALIRDAGAVTGLWESEKGMQLTEAFAATTFKFN